MILLLVLLVVQARLLGAGVSPSRTCLGSALPHVPASYAHIIQDNCHVGWPTWEVLQVMRPVCYANYSYFTPCNGSGSPFLDDPYPLDGTSFRADLEWFGHVQVYRMSVNDFERMVNAHTATWIRGLTYGTSIGFFPHSVQALLPMLNIPLLGWSLDQFVVLQSFPSVHGGRHWQWLYKMFYQHRWVTKLLPILLDCLGVTTQLGDESFYYEFTHRQHSNDAAIRNAVDLGSGPSGRRILCFDAMVVPNNAFSKNCDRTFIDKEYHAPLWGAFKRLVHRTFGIPPFQPSPIRIGFIEREVSRLILNQPEVISAIEKATGLKVQVVKFTKEHALDMQVRAVSQFHILVAAHGANMMNALFMHSVAVVVEIFLRDWNIPCYYGDILRLHGIHHRSFCIPAGKCGYHSDHRGAEYPRDDAVVDASALALVVKEELRLLRLRLAKSRLKMRQRPPYRLPQHQGIGMDGLLHPNATSLHWTS
eukprot:GGOE01018139.1.p1 GENE.GGOE01018139.1~~GGOE01018139.1.p1  ORF type:complete len:477 (-),score=102.21 GGOE01018139.1:153-1583(-)